MEPIKVSADIGENLTRLLEKLAQQIGTTADQIFPWYVKQSVIQGWSWLACLLFAFSLGLVLFFGNLNKADFDNGNTQAVFTVIGGIILFAALIAALGNISDIVSMILNPEYHAVKTLIRDLSRF